MAMTPKERQARYRQNSRAKWLASQKRYRETHRSERRKDGRERERARREKARADLIEALGGECAICGFYDARALTIDHVHDDGKSERILFKFDYVAMRRHMARTVRSGRYQVLCANCNTIKQWERMRAARK